MDIEVVTPKGNFLPYKKKDHKKSDDSHSNKDEQPEKPLASSSASISSLSKNLNDYYHLFETAGNTSAIKGLDVISAGLAEKYEFKDYLISSGFIESVNNFKDAKNTTFEKIFEVIGKIKECNLDFFRFIRAFDFLDNISLKENFVSISEKLLNPEEPLDKKRMTYGKFVYVVNSVLDNASHSAEHKHAILDDLFSKSISVSDYSELTNIINTSNLN